MSILLAAAIAELLLPPFSVFAGFELRFAWFDNLDVLGIAVGLTIFVACLAGSYPAFYLAAFKPAQVLKGNIGRGKQGLLFRNSLVVLQFSIAIVLLVSTAVISLQRRLADTIDLGFDKDQIVVVNSASGLGFKEDWTAFKQELLQNPAIRNVTASHFLPFGFNDNQAMVRLAGSTAGARIQVMIVDYDFFSTYGIAVQAGNDFAPERATDPGVLAPGANEAPLRFMLNAAAASALNMDAEEGIGGRLDLPDYNFAGLLMGVVDDTLFESIRSPGRPLLFILAPPDVPQGFQRFPTAAIKVDANAVPAALAHIDATFARHYPGQNLNRHFLEEDFQAQYQAEEKQASLLTWFSLLAVVIACFGLFGLASFNAERRTKEIGVRKVMGGSVWSIVVLLTNDFSKLVLLSNLIAWPVAYIAMQRWLENFAYRVDLTPVIFIGSGLIALCIAWVTVGGTAARAASAKPVLALRYE